LFVTDPKAIDPKAKQKPPDPAAMKVQADAQSDQAKLQFSAQKEQLNAQTLKEVETIKAQAMLQANAQDNATKERIAAADRQAQAQLALFDKNHNMQSEAIQLEGQKAQVQQAAKEIAVDNQLSKIETSATVDAALLQVKALVAQHENKMQSMLDKASLAQEKKAVSAAGNAVKPTDDSETKAQMQKMHKELIDAVGQIIAPLTANKSVTMTLPDGRKATAEVSTH
jgi:hypothetical protein